jgi:hypothetical protein
MWRNYKNSTVNGNVQRGLKCSQTPVQPPPPPEIASLLYSNVTYRHLRYIFIFIYFLSLLAEHRASFQRFLGLEVCIL